MPFASEKQRRFMHARHPEIAKRWEKEEKNMPEYNLPGAIGRKVGKALGGVLKKKRKRAARAAEDAAFRGGLNGKPKRKKKPDTRTGRERLIDVLAPGGRGYK